MKEPMMYFEVKSKHDGEDIITFASVSAQSIRTLSTRKNNYEDRCEMNKRGNCSWSKVQKWLRISSLS